MSGNESNTPKSLLACDTCYKRKVKCNRQNPCKNCVAAKTTCQWTRQIRVRRRKPNTADAVRTLEHRVHELESLLRQSRRSDYVPGGDHMEAGEPEDANSEPEPEPIPKKDKLQQYPQTSTTNRISNSSSRPLRLMDALARVREAGEIFSRFKPAACRYQESEILTSTDILNAMTRPSDDPTDFIPHSLVTKMGLTLLSDHPIPGAEKAQYSAILTFKAALALGQQAQITTNAVAHHVRRNQARKFKTIPISFRNAGPFSPPLSLSLLQAQCVQVAASQFFGDAAAARAMMVSVAQILVDLGYNMTEKHDEAVTSCVNLSYQWDRSMSVFMRQPPCLPPFEGNGRLVISRKLLYYLQDRVLHLASQQLNTTQRALEIEKLDREIKAHPDMQNDDTKLDFRLFATLTVLWHSHPGLHQKQVQTLLTGYARETLKLLNKFTVDYHSGVVSCVADITLHWDILCSGVLPMFVVCVHALRANDSSDYELLKGYTSIVSDLHSHYNRDNHLADQVQQLCVTLVQICEAVCTHGNTPPTNHTPFRKNFLNFDSFFVAQRQDDDSNEEDELDAMVAELLTNIQLRISIK